MALQPIGYTPSRSTRLPGDYNPLQTDYNVEMSNLAGQPAGSSSTLLSGLSSYTPVTMNSFTSPSIGMTTPQTGNLNLNMNPWTTGELNTINTGVSTPTSGFDTSGGLHMPDVASGGTGGLNSWMSSNKDLIGSGVSLATGLASAFNGWQANQTARDQLDFQKNSFNKQYESQKGLINSRLEDRQNMRRAGSGASRFEDTASYMNKYGVK